MERVLDVYKRSYDPKFPVVCMDESPKQLIAETRQAIAMAPGREARYDYEYRRCGVCSIFIANEPLAGTRMVNVFPTRTKIQWARFVKDIAQRWADAERITLVMDNLNTHRQGSLYEAFPAREAKKLYDRFEFIYTPKHGSWLNMAEIELQVLNRQCLNRRIDTIEKVASESLAWERERNKKAQKINWQFTTTDARIKLHRLYPTIDD